MAAHHRVYDSRHRQADCQKAGSAPEHCTRQSSILAVPFILRLPLPHLMPEDERSFEVPVGVVGVIEPVEQVRAGSHVYVAPVLRAFLVPAVIRDLIFADA